MHAGPFKLLACGCECVCASREQTSIVSAGASILIWPCPPRMGAQRERRLQFRPGTLEVQGATGHADDGGGKGYTVSATSREDSKPYDANLSSIFLDHTHRIPRCFMIFFQGGMIPRDGNNTS